MITTIIPFFLLASVPQDQVWQNGPEYQFSANAQVIMEGMNPTQTAGLNFTNILRCRPKQENVFRCQFQHYQLINFQNNLETGETKIRDMTRDEPELYEPVPFDVTFDSKGVRKIVLNEETSKNIRLGIIKIIINQLNVGIDLSTTKVDQEGQLEVNQSTNFLFGDCITNVKIGFSKEKITAKEGLWNLDLVTPLDKLNGRQFSVNKNWTGDGCQTSDKFIWSQLIGAYLDDDGLKTKKFAGEIVVSHDKFNSKMDQQWERAFEDKIVTVSETTAVSLDGIHAAVNEWPEISDPVTISFDLH